MSIFTGQESYKPIVEPITGNGDTLTNLQKLTMGAGSSRFEANIRFGLWLGADTFATAPFSVDFLGNLLASSVTIKNEDGDILIDSNSTTMDYVQIINSALNTSSKTILSDFVFEDTDYAGAFKTGTVAWSSTTGLITSGSGVVMNARGILGANAGTATFTLDATTGNATFAGTLTAATGTLGALTLATGGNIKAGKTAYSDDTNAGFWLGLDSGTPKLNMGSSATKYLHYDGTNLTMLGGTITGATIQTGTSGRRVVMSTDQYIRWYNGTDVEAYMWNDTGGDLEIDADNSITLKANGTSDRIWLYAGDQVYVQAPKFIMSCTNNWQINAADAIIMNYNSDNSGANFTIDEDGGNMALFDTGKDALFRDDLECSGVLSKGSGSFKIDHPLKPKTHYLLHSFVESPEMLNIYKGRGKLKQGKFTINLPDYFEALNKDFEYNLTPIGVKANLWIAKEVKNLKVEVEGDEDCDFSWVVYGVRQDKFALARPIEVEVEKNVEGYIHPELYGEIQNLGDKIISENWRRKKKGLEPLPHHNRKGFIKIKAKSKIDINVKKEMDEKNLKKELK